MSIEKIKNKKRQIENWLKSNPTADFNAIYDKQKELIEINNQINKQLA
jgi:hypothetical protein